MEESNEIEKLSLNDPSITLTGANEIEKISMRLNYLELAISNIAESLDEFLEFMNFIKQAYAKERESKTQNN